MASDKLKASLYSQTAPNSTQEARFIQFLEKRYQKEVELVWVERTDIESGFRLEVGDEVFNWTPEGKKDQLMEMLDKIKRKSVDTGEELISLFITSVGVPLATIYPPASPAPGPTSTK